MQILLLILAIIDIVGGAAILLSSNLILSDIARYVGIILIGKGIWSLFMSVIK